MKDFKFFLLLSALVILAGVTAAFMLPDPIPSPPAGKVLLRDELIRLND